MHPSSRWIWCSRARRLRMERTYIHSWRGPPHYAASKGQECTSTDLELLNKMANPGPLSARSADSRRQAHGQTGRKRGPRRGQSAFRRASPFFHTRDGTGRALTRRGVEAKPQLRAETRALGTASWSRERERGGPDRTRLVEPAW